MKTSKKTAHCDSKTENREHVGDIGERKVMFTGSKQGSDDLSAEFVRLLVGDTEEDVEDYCLKNGWMTEEEVLARRSFREIQRKNYSGYKRRRKARELEQ